MRQLKRLIRLHRFRLEESRRTLKELESLREQLGAAVTRLRSELSDEIKTVEVTPEIAFAFGDYATTARERLAKLVDSIDDTEQRIAQSREAVNDAFRELKKFEITQANRLRIAAESAARVEQADLDEVGLNIHRRRRGVI